MVSNKHDCKERKSKKIVQLLLRPNFMVRQIAFEESKVFYKDERRSYLKKVTEMAIYGQKSSVLWPKANCLPVY
jgi:hypothetical protein